MKYVSSFYLMCSDCQINMHVSYKRLSSLVCPLCPECNTENRERFKMQSTLCPWGEFHSSRKNLKCMHLLGLVAIKNCKTVLHQCYWGGNLLEDIFGLFNVYLVPRKMHVVNLWIFKFIYGPIVYQLCNIQVQDAY